MLICMCDARALDVPQQPATRSATTRISGQRGERSGRLTLGVHYQGGLVAVFDHRSRLSQCAQPIQCSKEPHGRLPQDDLLCRRYLDRGQQALCLLARGSRTQSRLLFFFLACVCCSSPSCRCYGQGWLAKPYKALSSLHLGAKSGPAADSETLSVHVQNTRCGT